MGAPSANLRASHAAPPPQRAGQQPPSPSRPTREHQPMSRTCPRLNCKRRGRGAGLGQCSGMTPERRSARLRREEVDAVGCKSGEGAPLALLIVQLARHCLRPNHLAAREPEHPGGLWQNAHGQRAHANVSDLVPGEVIGSPIVLHGPRLSDARVPSLPAARRPGPDEHVCGDDPVRPRNRPLHRLSRPHLASRTPSRRSCSD